MPVEEDNYNPVFCEANSVLKAGSVTYVHRVFYSADYALYHTEN